MALAHSPSIIMNGLVLCLDAGNPKSVAYQNFVALLVEAIKELKTEVENLKNIINNDKS